VRSAQAHAGKDLPQMDLAAINTEFAQEAEDAAVKQRRILGDQ
jgi:hypothetical protein